MSGRTKAERNTVGKRVGGARYYHNSAIQWSNPKSQKAIEAATQIACLRSDAFNVVKIEGEPPRRISLLSYEDFDANAFPALLDSWTIDLNEARCSHRTYRTSANPPILHRKELLLAPDDARRECFAELTKELERRNLFVKANSIGFRRQWEKRLAGAGIVVEGHAVQETNAAKEQPRSSGTGVERHRTAMARSALSAPMQALARHGFLDGDLSIFDYGCGRGDDMAVLSSAGILVSGWDPHYAPGTKLEEADVVNLGFVLNVIEEPSERIEAIQAAFGLARRLMAVAVMLVGKANTSTLRPFRDGFVTAHNTFQKYFSQHEARALVSQAVGEEAIPVGPGIFFVFRDKISEQRFLEGRRRRHRDISHLLAIAPPRTTEARAAGEALLEEHRELIDAVWKAAIELGRLPDFDELDDSVRQELIERLGSVRKTVQLAQHIYSAEALHQARQQRTDDLRVYFALNRFSRRQRYRELPVEMQRDIKAFFGSHGAAEKTGQELLFSLGDAAVIHDAAQSAESQGLGWLDGAHSLQLDARLVERLPPPLRAYVGCAEQLYGHMGDANIVKIHLRSSKLTLLHYEKYAESPLPRLRERIKINLRNQAIDFFDYGDDVPWQLLYMKSRYMAPDQRGYAKQKKFDAQLQNLKGLDFRGFGPSVGELVQHLQASRLTIDGFKIVPSIR